MSGQEVTAGGTGGVQRELRPLLLSGVPVCPGRQFGQDALAAGRLGGQVRGILVEVTA
ncbi:hypothetical protein OG504_07955 [Streptomyces sp. NBC_00986]|nr:hypothetical protein OG504_07955 [Streptomyces sp. NBC_00986]